MTARRFLIATAAIALGGVAAPATALAQERTVREHDRVDAVLRPGDRVRLKVWREPDLSGEFVVDEDGIVVFPKVGRINVHELSPDSLKSLLVARYSASLRDPAVEVTVLRRVNVLGAVRNPGLYYVDPTTTVADVLALAGGANPDGYENRVELLRNGKRLPIRLSRESRLGESQVQSGDQLRVPQRSWLVRNTALLSVGVTAMAVVFAALSR